MREVTLVVVNKRLVLNLHRNTGKNETLLSKYYMKYQVQSVQNSPDQSTKRVQGQYSQMKIETRLHFEIDMIFESEMIV